MKYAREFLSIEVGQKAIKEATEMAEHNKNETKELIGVRCFKCGKILYLSYKLDLEEEWTIGQGLDEWTITCPHCGARISFKLTCGWLIHVEPEEKPQVVLQNIQSYSKERS